MKGRKEKNTMSGFLAIPPPPGFPAIPPPPSPGQVAGAVEDFISGGLRGAIDAVRTAAGQSAANPGLTATIMDPATGRRGELGGVVSRDEFVAFQRQVVDAFHAVAADLASSRAYGAGDGGLYGGNAGGGIDAVTLLLLTGAIGGTGTTTIDPLVLILLMGNGGGGGFGGMDPLVMMLLLGLI